MIENRPLWGTIQLLTLHAPEIARAIRPGQFALARDPSTFDPYLRRTLWMYKVHDERVEFSFSASDPLANRVRTGDTLDLLTPLGRAIEFNATARHILLIGEGPRIAQLIAIAHDAVNQGREVVLASYPVPIGEGIEVYPPHLLSPEIEYRTDDVLNSELITWADALIVSGSSELFRAVADALRAVRYRLGPGFARILLEMPMPCGIGVCYACTVNTLRGVRLVCVDGPTIDLVEFERGRTR